GHDLAPLELCLGVGDVALVERRGGQVAKHGADDPKATAAAECADNRDDHPGLGLLFQLLVGAPRRATRHRAAPWGSHWRTIAPWMWAARRTITARRPRRRSVPTRRSTARGTSVASRWCAAGGHAAGGTIAARWRPVTAPLRDDTTLPMLNCHVRLLLPLP